MRANLYTQLEQISEEDLDRSREKGSWTIRQIVNHLAEIKAILNLE